MKNGTGFNKTGQHGAVSLVHARRRLVFLSLSHPRLPLFGVVCSSDTFSTHIGHEKAEGRGKLRHSDKGKFRAWGGCVRASHEKPFWSRQQYDNLVRLACFIRRYFSNATLTSSHVAPIIHTCSGSGVVQTSLKCRTNPNELYRNRLKSCTFYEMRINEILKFWWREFSLLGRLECGAWRAWDREPIRN